MLYSLTALELAVDLVVLLPDQEDLERGCGEGLSSM